MLRLKVNPPPDVQAKVEAESKRSKLGRADKLQLGEEKFKALEKAVARRYERWEEQARHLRRRLVRYNDLMEGVVAPTNFPFEGASNVTLRYAAGMARTFRSTFNKTMFQDPNLFSPVFDGEPPANVQEVEAKANESFHSDCNGLDTIISGVMPCFRDGTLVVMGSWERRVEQLHDSQVYTSDAEFVSDYPNAEAAGISQERYDEVLDHFISALEPEVNAVYQFDNVEYDGPEYDIIPLAKFVFYPTYAQSIRRMELYGRQYNLSRQEVKARAKRHRYYQESVKRLLGDDEKMERPFSNLKPNEWDSAKNYVEGLAPRAGEDDQPAGFVDFVVREDLDGDGIPEKYMGTFATDKKVLMCAYDYQLKRGVDFCVAFRFIKREGRFLGVSLLGDGEDLFNLMDGIHRHRNNVRMLTSGPVLVANEKYKEQIDLARGEHVFRPGLTFWVQDTKNSIEQLVLQNLDQPGNSLDEENLIVRYIELLIGPTQGLSGRESPTDPRSPMGKTLALLNQANQRIDEYIDEFKRGLPELLDLHIALHEQFGFQESGLAEMMRAPKYWRVKRRSVTMSPEFAMQRLGGLMQTYAGLQALIAQGDPIAIELWNRMLTASDEPDREKMLAKPPQAQLPMAMPAGGRTPGMGLMLGPENMPQEAANGSY